MMDNVFQTILGIVILSTILAGFKITIKNFHFEFKGLIRIIFKLIYGIDLDGKED